MVLALSLHLPMAVSSSCSSVLPLQFFSSFSFSPSESPTFLFYQTPNSISSLKFSRKPFLSNSKHLTVSFALTETGSDSPNSLPPSLHSLLQNLADCFDLKSDYFAQLPNDLRLDLNDAAFDLSNGPVINECGQELGETLLNLSRAWELADTSTSCALAKKLPELESSLTDNSKSAFGKRLISAGRRFQSMGQYGQGELQKIAKTMIATGKLLSVSSMSTTAEEQPKKETRMFKFGELQVEVTPEKANIGAAIGFVFGILSWKLGQGIQSIPESSLQYANDNALLLAKSLRGALLALCYSSTVLSACTTVGLFLYARQLASKEKWVSSLYLENISWGRQTVTNLEHQWLQDIIIADLSIICDEHLATLSQIRKCSMAFSHTSLDLCKVESGKAVWQKGLESWF